MRHPLTHVRAGRYRARTGRRHEVTQAISPVGCCLARDGQRLGMSTKKDAVIRSGDFFVVDGTGLEQQQRRPRPAAETGRSCWGSVLIFQGPAKGLKKNQQTQPVRRHEVTQAISPVGCCLARDGQRLGMSTKKDAVIRSGDFFVVDGTGLEQQQRRPRPAAETGRSCWGSVLIFQGPAKGLKKNQQTQPVRRRIAP